MPMWKEREDRRVRPRDMNYQIQEGKRTYRQRQSHKKYRVEIYSPVVIASCTLPSFGAIAAFIKTLVTAIDGDTIVISGVPAMQEN